MNVNPAVERRWDFDWIASRLPWFGKDSNLVREPQRPFESPSERSLSFREKWARRGVRCFEQYETVDRPYVA